MSGAFEGERAVVVGLGASGIAAARGLAEEGASVRVTEARPRGELPISAELEGLGIEIETGGHERSHLDGATLVVTSPGVPQSAAVLSWATERGLRLWSELELGARLCRTPYLAVTGTNGKTTTTEMIAGILRAAGMDAVACGNIGHPFTAAARERHDVLAVEASSFQLRFHESFHPKVSVLLNLADDHLDWHGGFAAYTEAKARIFERQGKGDTHVANADDERAAAVSRRVACDLVWFRLDEPAEGEVGYAGGELVARLGAGTTRLGPVAAGAGAGYRADAAAATAATLAFGVEPLAAARGLTSMPALPHRGSAVGEVAGVVFVDDSKATNPHATLAALANRHGVVLIAGGLSKGVDLSPLGSAADRLRGVVAIGAAAPEVLRIFEGKVPVRRAGTMDDAVRAGHELAAGEGTVLLAPACASQDMFRDYHERGEAFAAAVAELQREVAVRG